MKIAVLFDGAGLARPGLEQAGHDCIGYELDPAKHYLSQFIGSGQCVLADATTIDLSGYDAIWSSPPCQHNSSARTQGEPISAYATDWLDWCLSLATKYPDTVVWVENVLVQGKLPTWGTVYNAAQFLRAPIQQRNRVIGGRYKEPVIYRSYRKVYPLLNLCPAITATEYKGGGVKKDRRASRFYGRRLTVQECAYHQGLDSIPSEWFVLPEWYTVPEGKSGTRQTNWRNNLYEAIGNAVPVYMARAFGAAYSSEIPTTLLQYKQTALF